MNRVLIQAARTIILYSLLMIIIRVMGKHQIGQLQPYELVITILIAELAAIPMQDTEIPIINGIVPIVTLLLIQVTLSLISLKNSPIRQIICGHPSILIENGRINEYELSRLRYNIHDLLEQLRLKNIFNIADVAYAILETSGKLSVIPYSQKRPVNPEDLHLNPPFEGLPLPLIIDGKLQRENLQKYQLTEDWLLGEVQKNGLVSNNDVLFACRDNTGKLYIQPKNISKSSKIS